MNGFKVVSQIQRPQGIVKTELNCQRQDEDTLNYLLRRLKEGTIQEDVALGEGVEPSAVVNTLIVIF